MAAVAVSLASCSALAPMTTLETTVLTRRSAAFAMMIGSAFVATPAFAVEDVADDVAAAQKAAAEAAKERMRQKIADSKKNYRSTAELVKDRKETTDYSCVEATGSPCAQGLERVKETFIGK